MRYRIIILSLTLSLPTIANADLLGLKLGLAAWDAGYGGRVQSDREILDIENDLDIEEKTSQHYFIAFEHFVPIVPSIMVRRTEIKVNSTNVISRDLLFEGVDFSKASKLKSTLDLSYTDLTLYYKLFIVVDPFHFDAGLSLRFFNHGIELEELNTNQKRKTSSLKIDATYPMLFTRFKVDLPKQTFFGIEGNWISLSGESLLDTKVNFGYRSILGMGVELGFRRFKIEYENDNRDNANINIDGIYIGLSYFL